MIHIQHPNGGVYCGQPTSSQPISLSRARNYKPVSQLCSECKARVINEDHQKLVQQRMKGR